MATPTHSVEEYVKKAIKTTLEERKTVESSSPTTSEVVATGIKKLKEIPLTKATLREGEVWASELLHETMEADFPVRTYKEEDWDDRIRFLVPKPSKDYVIPKEQATNILRAWQINDKSLVYGPTGSGKSSLIKELCALTGRPFLRINATGDMDSSQLFGQLTAADGSTIWQDGSITEAVRYGAVLGWDEWEVTPPEIAMGLQWLLEDDSKLFLKEMPGTSKDKMIDPHEAFRIVCMGNTQGQGDETGHHSGTNVQNTATLDRFGTVIHLDYLPQNHELNVIRNRVPTIAEETATMMIKVATVIRSAYKSNQVGLTMSPRTLIGIAKKMESGVCFEQALALQYLNKLSGSNYRVAKELCEKVTGKVL